MSILDRILDKTSEVTRGTRLHTLVEATDTFLRHPITPLTGSPYLRAGMDAKRFMFIVVLALLPPLGAAIYFYGLRVLLVVLASYVAGGIVEVVFATIRRHPISEGFLVTGLLLPLTLPVDTPLWMVALGSAFGVFFGKEVFGGVGKNIFNPALVGRAFLFLSFPKALSNGWVIESPTWWKAGALGQLAQNAGEPVADVITSATPMITTKLAMAQGVGASEAIEGSFSFYQLITGWAGGSMGETSALLILLGGLFLFATRVGNWRAPAAALGTLLLSSALLHALDPARFIPPHYAVVAGSFLFGITYMLTDPVSAPGSNLGRYVYGAGVGLLVVLIRGLSGYPEGVMFSILIMNVFAPLIDAGIQSLQRRRIQRRLRHV